MTWQLRHRIAHLSMRSEPLPRNPNGKIDRKLLSTAWIERRHSA